MLYFARKNVLFDYLLEIKKFKIKSKIQMVGNFVFCDTIKRAFQKGFSFCDNILKTNDFVRLCANLRQITARSQRYKKKDFKITRKQSFKDKRYKKCFILFGCSLDFNVLLRYVLYQQKYKSSSEQHTGGINTKNKDYH